MWSAIPRLRRIPGGQRSRLRAAGAYIKPLWNWCVPIFSLPPADVAKKLYAAILRTKCTWWCQGRWWAQHVDMHPHYSMLLAACQRISTWDLAWSRFLEANFVGYLENVGLEFVAFCPARGVQFRRRAAETDRRVLKAFGRKSFFWT